jgi:DNA polymerase
MDERQRRAWAALDIGPIWRQTRALSATGVPRNAQGMAEAAAADPASPMAAASVPIGEQVLRPWAELRQAVAVCAACGLADSRTQVVFGVGPQPAPWMVIGEAPGQQEDERGEPFVGPAGQLLDAMLAAIGVDRSSSAFIANVLKCRPPRNRDPLPDEVAACAPWLSQQIRAIDPRVILVVGRIAARALLGTESSLASLRGTVHRVSVGERDIPVVVTYHPAYLLRSLPDKARAWADLSLARQVFEST